MKFDFYIVYNKKGLVSARKSQPSLARGEFATKLKIEVPDSVFESFIPSAKLTVPEEFIQRPEVEAELLSFNDGEALPNGDA